MKAFKSAVLIVTVVGAMMVVGSSPARSNPVSQIATCAESVVASVVTQYCPPGCSCSGGCTCGIANPCTKGDCKAASSLNGCNACCTQGAFGLPCNTDCSLAYAS